MWKKLLLSLAALLLTPLVLELGCRGWSSLGGEALTPSEVRVELARILERSRGNFGGEPGTTIGGGKGGRPPTPQVRSPFYGFGDPLMDQRVERSFMRIRKRPDDYFLVVLGGSVAAGFGNHGAHRLAGRLSQAQQFEGRDVQVLNFGIAAFKQPQQLNLLSYLISLGLRVDGVLNLDGFNEVAVSNANQSNGVHPLYPSSVKWMVLAMAWEDDPECLQLAAGSQALQVRTQERAQQLLDGPWLQSALVGNIALRRVRDLARRAEQQQAGFLARANALEPGPGVVGPPYQGNLGARMAFCARNWMECSISMHAICQARGIDYLHVLQPTLHDEGSKPVTAEERASGGATKHWLDAVAHGYPLLRLAGESLQRSGVPFFDATGAFREVEETLYYDACHFNEQGNEILADALAGAFVESLGASPGASLERR